MKSRVAFRLENVWCNLPCYENLQNIHLLLRSLLATQVVEKCLVSDPNFSNNYSRCTTIVLLTFLYSPSARGCTNMVKLLLDYGSDVLLQDDQGYTPLHLAAAWGCPLTVQVLLDAASDIYATNRNNKTAADVSQSSAGSSLLHAVACQTPKLQYLCILVIRKLLCNDPVQKIDRLPVSQLLKDRIANISLVERIPSCKYTLATT